MFIAILLITLAATMCSAAWWRSVRDERSARRAADDKLAPQDEDEDWTLLGGRERTRGVARAVSMVPTRCKERQARLDRDQENDRLRRHNDLLALLFSHQALTKSQKALTKAKDLTVTKTRERDLGLSR